MNSLPLNAVLKNVVDNRGKTCPVSDSGLPLIATNCVKNSSLFPSFEKVRYVSDETYRDWFRGHPEPGDLIFVLKGAPGQVCLTPDPVSFCIAQDMVALRADEKIIYPPYLFAALRSKYMQNAIVNMHVGTMIPHFKKGDFDKLDIPVPEEDVQKTIGDSYLEFSQKIELNRQINTTLETMAQAIFKDWFVDFGPTVRKAEGETDPVKILGGLIPDPVKATRIAALFPDSFNDGNLPQGWVSQFLIDQAHWVNGAAYKKMHFVDRVDGLPVIKIAELKAGITKQTKFTNTALNEKFRINNGELLFSWSGNPQTSIDTFLWTKGEAWLNQHIFAVRENETRSKPFLFSLLKYLKPTFTSIAQDKQTTGLGHVTKGDMKRIEVTIANDAVMQSFNELVEPIFNKILANKYQNQTLAETRDYLLPKLMSDEVRVSEAAPTASAEMSNVVGLDKDLFGRKHLPVDQAAERDAVMVAAIIDLLDSDGFVVGNFRYQKGVYFLKRYLDLPQFTTTKQAAGPYDAALRYEGGHQIAKQRKYIREGFIDGKTGNKSGSNISEAKSLIDKYDLRNGLKWIADNFRYKSNEQMECLATVDFAMNELRSRGASISVDAIIQDINRDEVWRPKLTKAHFRQDKIRDAIAVINKLFGTA